MSGDALRLAGVVNNRQLDAGAYFGAVGDRVESSHAVLSEVVHPRSRQLPVHDHAQAYFCLLLAGDYVEGTAGRELRYRPFEVGFHPARFPHRDAIGNAGARFLCLEVRADPLGAADVRLRDAPALLAADISVQLLRLYRHFVARTLSPIVFESTVWELCGDVSREVRCRDTGRPAWLRRCLELVEEEFGQPLTVEEMARRTGVHPVHLSREFRRRFGETLGEYANKVRVRRACTAMTNDRAPLADVAAATGFADQSHFCRVFKRLVGCTPSAFRRLSRNVEH
jgi:AraC family transcriptional regulator